MDIGTKVKIKIHNPISWVSSAVKCLNDKTGKVAEIKETDRFTENNILVEFDTAADTWYSYQTPWAAAWFSEKDLILL